MLMIGLIGSGAALVIGLIVFLVIRRKIKEALGQPVWHLLKHGHPTRWY